MQTNVSILSVVTGDSVTTEKLIPRRKGNIKSPAMLSLIKDKITNQYINILITKNYKNFYHI